MTSNQKVNEFNRLLNNFRTEWLIFDLTAPNLPNNIQRIKNICKQIVNLDVTIDDFRNARDEKNSSLR
jgi:hypothetical protein